MKKVLISATLLIGMMAGALVFSSFTKANEQDETTFSQINAQGNEKYEEVTTVSGVYINIKSGQKKGFSKTLYKGINTCGEYYLQIGLGLYYPVHKNSDSKFKDVDVSNYNYYAQSGDWRYFFFY